MVFCIIAMVIFGFLGLFSAKYRGYAKESFNCVFRMATLRKCNTSFDKKMQMKISGGLAKRNKTLGRFVYKNFSVISWVFVVIMLASLAYSLYGLYNLAVLGTCDPQNPENCIFVSQPKCGSISCDINGCYCGEQEIGCNADNNFAACDGNCDCNAGACPGQVSSPANK